jgi:hypothetical protein
MEQFFPVQPGKHWQAPKETQKDLQITGSNESSQKPQYQLNSGDD